MKVSIVIPTYNGSKKIVKLLEGLEQQTFTDFETIIIIDGSQDDTYEILQSKKYKLQSLRIENQSNKGRAGARNSGAALTTGDILLFVDDDIIPVKEFVQLHAKAQEQHDIVVGFLEPYDTAKKKEVFAYSDYNNLKWNTNIQEKNKDMFYITANNFSIKKKIFDEVGGFDGRLRDAEDFDLAIRLKERRHEIAYEPRAIGYHMLPSSFAETMKRAGEYGRARKALMEVNPTAAAYFSEGTNSISKFKRPIFYLFTHPIFIKMADKNMMTVLPKKLRFKIYDIMMTAHTIFQ